VVGLWVLARTIPPASVHAIVKDEAGASDGFSRLPRSSAQQEGVCPCAANTSIT
jgi:hypothetical protein